MPVLDMLISKHFITFFLVLVCSIKLHSMKTSRNAELRFFWLTVIACFLLALEDWAESIASMAPEMRFWRILFSVFGYTCRPVAAIGLLMVIEPPEKRTWKLWIPSLINMVIYLTAFFSPIAFSYDAEYDFVRGPLGFSVFVISCIYIIEVLLRIFNRFSEGRGAEGRILVICGVATLLSAIVDALRGGTRVNEAILISSVFLLFFLRSHDNRNDALTGLLNRQAYYEDLNVMGNTVTAIASIDMNGLKDLNDSKGHEAGDAALVAIGKCFHAHSYRDAISYRMGGDEFVMLFLEMHEARVERILHEISADVTAAGYSVSCGWAMREDGQDLDEVLRLSDQSMYARKAQYYLDQNRDRRGRRNALTRTWTGERGDVSSV